MTESSSLAVQLDAKSRFLIWLRLGRLEYITHSLLVMLPAYLASGEFRWPAFLTVVITPFISLMSTSYVNHYTDQAEDRINLPERVKLCEMVGYRNIRNVGLAFSALSVLWALAFVYVGNPTVVLIYLLGTFVRMNFSWGLRFKRHFALMAIPYALAPLLQFAGVWAINQPLRTLPPVVFILAYERVALSSIIKTLPDALGDRRAGVRTLFTGRPRIASMIIFIIWFSTYVLVALLVLPGILEPKYLIMLITLPMTIYGAWWMWRVRSAEEKENLFRYAAAYGLISNAIPMLIFAPTVPVLVALVAAIAYSYVVSYLMGRARFSFLRFYTR